MSGVEAIVVVVVAVVVVGGGASKRRSGCAGGRGRGNVGDGGERVWEIWVLVSSEGELEWKRRSWSGRG
jgi:hypothetical protein